MAIGFTFNLYLLCNVSVVNKYNTLSRFGDNYYFYISLPSGYLNKKKLISYNNHILKSKYCNVLSILSHAHKQI